MNTLVRFEALFLIILSYLAWSLGDVNRMNFSGIVNYDYWDLIITLISVVTGFYGWVYGIKSSILKKQPKLKHFLIFVFTFSFVLLIIYVEEILIYGDFSVNGFLSYTTPLYVIYCAIIIPYIYFARQKSDRSDSDNELRKIEVETFKGKRIIYLKDVFYFQSLNKQTYVISEDNNRYPINLTLKELEDILPCQQFFRANRQFIISRSIVKGYDIDTFQKLQVSWKDNLKLDFPMVVVSKYTSPKFKNWLNL